MYVDVSSDCWDGMYIAVVNLIGWFCQVYGFNPRQRKAFYNSILRYGMPPSDAYYTSWLPKELKGKSQMNFKLVYY